MTRATAIAAVAALFAAGVSIGALGIQVLDDRREPRQEEVRPPVVGPPRDMMRHRMIERLGLSPEQERQLEDVLEESRREGDAIREELRPKVEALMERTREEIAEILTPQQLERFDRMHDRMGGPHRRFLLGEPPPRRGPRARTSAGRGAGSGRRNAD